MSLKKKIDGKSSDVVYALIQSACLQAYYLRLLFEEFLVSYENLLPTGKLTSIPNVLTIKAIAVYSPHHTPHLSKLLSKFI